jgi:hypothetical protein
MPFVNSGEITKKRYNYFLSKEGYNYFRDDMWTSLEQQNGLVSPKRKPVGMVIELGEEYTTTHLDKVWKRARGFIFCEKEGAAVKLKPLSLFGWVIVAGQGYPTRLMRRLLKEDTRPVLALHDFDPDGAGIYRALGYKTRRTAHLDIDLGQRVIDLGLLEEHCEALNLPTQATPEKYQKKGIFERVELSALSTLKLRMDVEEPLLAFVVSLMHDRGIILSSLPEPRSEMAKDNIRWTIERIIRPIIDRIVDDHTKDIEGDSVGVRIEADEQTIDIPDLEARMNEISSALVHW